jgi:hypothetical protein
MKKIIVLLSLISIASCLNSCNAGYVADEPTYIETIRPIRPGSNYIWIEGDWRWNNHTRSYKHQNGRWETPKRGRNYNQGHWNKSTQGFKWEKGRR